MIYSAHKTMHHRSKSSKMNYPFGQDHRHKQIELSQQISLQLPRMIKSAVSRFTVASCHSTVILHRWQLFHGLKRQCKTHQHTPLNTTTLTKTSSPVTFLSLHLKHEWNINNNGGQISTPTTSHMSKYFSKSCKYCLN